MQELRSEYGFRRTKINEGKTNHAKIRKKHAIEAIPVEVFPDSAILTKMFGKVLENLKRIIQYIS